MVADDTASHRSQKGMMGGMTGNATHDRAFDAAFRVGRRCHYHRHQHHRCIAKKCLHIGSSSAFGRLNSRPFGSHLSLQTLSFNPANDRWKTP